MKKNIDFRDEWMNKNEVINALTNSNFEGIVTDSMGRYSILYKKRKRKQILYRVRRKSNMHRHKYIRTYEYLNVPEQIYDESEKAKSIAKYLIANVYSNFESFRLA